MKKGLKCGHPDFARWLFPSSLASTTSCEECLELQSEKIRRGSRCAHPGQSQKTWLLHTFITVSNFHCVVHETITGPENNSHTTDFHPVLRIILPNFLHPKSHCTYCNFNLSLQGQFWFWFYFVYHPMSTCSWMMEKWHKLMAREWIPGPRVMWAIDPIAVFSGPREVVHLRPFLMKTP